MTPRAQLARVLVGATFAVLVGAGPAIAWDVSTQPPLDRVLGPRCDFGVECGAKEAERVLPLGEGLARELLALASDRRQLEHASVRADSGEDDVRFVLATHADCLAASSSES